MYTVILQAAGRILMSMVLPLVTEKAIKSLTILALEKLAKRTESDIDDRLVQTVKDAWESKEDGK